MIDLHCHLLPGIDDGARDMDEALELARRAVADGIQVSVVTPHVHLGRYDNDRGSIEPRVAAFRDALAQAGIPLRVFGAGEVRIGPEIQDLLAQEQLPFIGRLGAHRVVLLEFPHGGLPVGAERFVRWMIAHKVRPLIAHPERNKELIAEPGKLRAYVDMGCLLQLTAGSVVGQFGDGAQAAAEYFLREEWVYAIATDAHDLEHRIPNLGAARDALVARGAAELARRLTLTNPARLLGLTEFLA